LALVKIRTVHLTPGILGFIRAGEIDYSTVNRIVERVTFTENIAIAMGREVVKPQNLKIIHLTQEK